MGIASLRRDISDTSTKVGDQVCGSENCHSSHDTQRSSQAGVIAKQTTDNRR
jgi:hypothetical protein